MRPPFRGTFKGIIEDVQDVDYSLSGQPKRFFVLIDTCGSYVKCCALKHNCMSASLQNYQEVMIFNGHGRPAIGSDAGMLYLQKDSFIYPIGQPRTTATFRTACIEISQTD